MPGKNIQGLFRQAGGPEPEASCRGRRSGGRDSYRSISGDGERDDVHAHERDAPHDDDERGAPWDDDAQRPRPSWRAEAVSR
jgi:hypothetical protein